MPPRVLIATVYAPGTWDLYPAQRWFLDRTTADCRLMVASPERPPEGCEWIEWQPPRARSSHQHVSALRLLLPRFSAGDYDLGLILDSDAFPVKRRWASELLEQLRQKQKLFAAPVRVENGDVFPHVSFLAFLPAALPRIVPAINVSRGPGVWDSRRDTGALLPMKDCLPLLRSNVYSPSPVLHSIYADLAYHRGAGSRRFNVRGWKQYWRDVAPRLHDPQCDRQPLTPEWINRLLGERRFPEENIPEFSPSDSSPGTQCRGVSLSPDLCPLTPFCGGSSMPVNKRGRGRTRRTKPAKPEIDQVVKNIRGDLARFNTTVRKRIYQNAWGYTPEELLAKLGPQRKHVEDVLASAEAATTAIEPVSKAK